MLRRPLWLGVVLVQLVGVAIAAFAAAAAPVKLTFMDWWGPPRSDAYQAIIKAFEAKYPDISVEYVQGPGSTALAEKVMVMAAAGTAPDLAAITYARSAQLVQSGFALDLTALIAQDVPNVKDLLVPGVLESGTYRGHVYGLPKVFNSSHLFADTDMLLEAGLPIPQKGWTTSTFRAYLLKLTQQDASGRTVRYGVGNASFTEGAWLAINGGAYLDPETGMAAFQQPAFAGALQWAADLKNVDHVMGGFKSTTSDFTAGKIAFSDDAYVSNVPTVVSGFGDDHTHWSTVYFPQGEASTPTRVWGHPIMIWAHSKHPHEAWEFLKFLTFSDEANRIRAQYSIAPAALSGVRELKRLAQLPSWLDQDAIFAPFLALTSNLATRPDMTPGFEDADAKYITPALQSVMRGETDAATALSRIAEPVNRIIQDASKG